MVTRIDLGKKIAAFGYPANTNSEDIQTGLRVNNNISMTYTEVQPLDAFVNKDGNTIVYNLIDCYGLTCQFDKPFLFPVVSVSNRTMDKPAFEGLQTFGSRQRVGSHKMIPVNLGIPALPLAYNRTELRISDAHENPMLPAREFDAELVSLQYYKIRGTSNELYMSNFSISNKHLNRNHIQPSFHVSDTHFSPRQYGAVNSSGHKEDARKFQVDGKIYNLTRAPSALAAMDTLWRLLKDATAK